MKDDDSILDAEIIGDVEIIFSYSNRPHFPSNTVTAGVWTSDRFNRLSPKRRLLYKLALTRKINKKNGEKNQYVMTEQETELYLSLMPRWKRILVQMMWGAEQSAMLWIGRRR